jgi:hypothetical protein
MVINNRRCRDKLGVYQCEKKAVSLSSLIVKKKKETRNLTIERAETRTNNELEA